MLVDWDPILVRLGPLAIRWYGFFMAVSMAIGLFVLVKHGRRRGYDEDYLYNVSALMIVGGVIGARLVYVLTNLGDYFGPGRHPIEVIRVDHGGLSLHGALLGGAMAAWWYIRRALGGDTWAHFSRLLDLTVPGIAVGYMLVRIGNIFNHEVLGNPVTALPFPRHPVQLYASAAGLVLLLVHNRLARSNPPAGYLFWSFLYYYQWWRVVFEETVRDVPLALPLYANPALGIEIITVTQATTWPLLLVAWWMRKKALRDRISPDTQPGPGHGETEETLPPAPSES
ncbi:MAG TPA: prolipoprotein diacylglyceryl transferase [Thermaerobacter sp.]